MAPAVPLVPALAALHWPSRIEAPPQWQQVDFISDLHLHAGDPATFDAWSDYLHDTSAQAVFILGDLFEAWVGDDCIQAAPADAQDAFALACADQLQRASRQRSLFFLCGNRDFLVGDALLRHCGMQGLADPCVLDFCGARHLLSHGDALCLDDTDYQRFRATVRSAPWQADFLARPLAERQATARQLRTRSEQHKRMQPTPSVVDRQATLQWLRDADASVLIHGHTHQPANHRLPAGQLRIVLSDWDLAARPPRAEVLRLSRHAGATPVRLQRLSPNRAR